VGVRVSGAQRADGAVPDGGGIRGEERRRLRLLGGSSGTGSVGRASRAISVGGVGGSIGSSGGGGSDPGGRVRGTENAGVPGDDVLGLVPHHDEPVVSMRAAAKWRTGWRGRGCGRREELVAEEEEKAEERDSGEPRAELPPWAHSARALEGVR